jgi:hypothetical protein
MRAFALLIGRHAARVMDPVRPVQAAAMYAEIENLDDREALAWALGCLAASYQARASFMAVAIIGARLCVATAAGAFGLFHLAISFQNIWMKLASMNGLPLPGRAEYLEIIATHPLDYYLRVFGVLSVVGLSHVIAALLMAAGRNDRVQQAAVVIVIIEVLMAPAVGTAGPLMAMIYIFLITLMAVTSSGLTWLWRRDMQRMAGA